MVRRILLTSAVALAIAPAAVTSAVPVATPAGATSVREYQGTIVFSQYVPAEQHWRLAIRRPGGAPEILRDVRPAARPFGADIGSDSKGRPQLVYPRCDETCDLFVYSLSAGKGERAVRNANDPANDDVAPTLWRGQIAWARIYGEQADGKVVVYTKALTAPRSRPSTRLPGVPLKRSRDDGAGTSVTSGRAVDALELYGDNLAQVVSYTCRGCSGISQTELRLLRLRARTSTPVAFQVTGLSGQQLVGPSFTAGTLGFYRACLGDPSGCQNGGATPYRYRLSTRQGFRGTPGPVRVFGFADAGEVAYRVEGCNFETQGEFNAACRIEEVPAASYVPARIPQRD
jgi:hypothetical protein